MPTIRSMDVTDAEVAAKNHIYDGAASFLWQWLVYEPVHGGRAFANIGGAAALDAVARVGRLTHQSRVLELCSGMGDTCRYLAERTGCSVVGVDINDRQIAAARDRLAARPPARGHVELVHSDVRALKADGRFDLVYAMDSLVLLPDLADLLARARQLLRPGGHFAAAEVTAGPLLSARFRQHVWEEDGFISLVTPEEFVAFLERAGFVDAAVESHQGDATRCFQMIWREAGRRRGDIAATYGPRAYHEWRRLSAIYARAFREQWLSYAWIHASRAEQQSDSPQEMRNTGEDRTAPMADSRRAVASSGPTLRALAEVRDHRGAR